MPDAAAVPQSVIQQLPVDQIRPSQHQARKTFDEEGLKSLAESIRAEGLLQPVTVFALDGGGFELVSGERRLRAYKLLGLPKIEAKIIQPISPGEAAAKGLVENLQREDLDAMEEAEGFDALHRLDSSYWTHDQISKVTGKSRTYITKSFSLLSLPEPIQANVRRRTLDRSHALELLGLPTPELQIQAATQMAQGQSIQKTRAAFAAFKKPRPAQSAEPAFPISTSGEDKAFETRPQAVGPLAGELDLLGVKKGDGLPGQWELQYQGGSAWSVKVDLPAGSLEDPAAIRQALAQVLDHSAETIRLKKQALTPKRTAVPVPQIQTASYISGNRLQLTWSPCGEGFTYRIFRSRTPDGPISSALGDGAGMAALGVNIDCYAGIDNLCQVAVMAIDAHGQESELSQPVTFELKPWNKDNTVEPLS